VRGLFSFYISTSSLHSLEKIKLAELKYRPTSIPKLKQQNPSHKRVKCQKMLGLHRGCGHVTQGVVPSAPCNCNLKIRSGWVVGHLVSGQLSLANDVVCSTRAAALMVAGFVERDWTCLQTARNLRIRGLCHADMGCIGNVLPEH